MLILPAICLFLFHHPSPAQTLPSHKVIFENVNIFDGKTNKLTPNRNVLVEGNKIIAISAEPLNVTSSTMVINGKGKTLIPGLIDVHVHMMFCAMSRQEMLAPYVDMKEIMGKVAAESQKILMRGFTAVRDVGGPDFALKTAIDKGQIEGLRIWPAGAMISQTAGHGDFRTPDKKSRGFFGNPSHWELYGASFVAYGRDEVLTAVRENLRAGASEIKLMAGGGTFSTYDPVDVTQYMLDEMEAAVEAAEDWGTYVIVHAYTPHAIFKAAKEGQEKLWPLAKKMNVKLAWGTDFLFEPWLNEKQNEYLLKLQKWLPRLKYSKWPPTTMLRCWHYLVCEVHIPAKSVC